MAAIYLVSKWQPVIDMGVISLSLNFSPVALQTAEIWTLKKIQDGHHGSKMATMVSKWLYGSN